MLTFERIRRVTRFRLRTLFVAVSVCAAAMAWLAAQRQWVRDRQEAKEWAQGSVACNLAQAGSNERLPIGLRLMREQPMEYFQIDVDQLDQPEIERVEQLRHVFPEARVVLSHSVRRDESFVEQIISELRYLTSECCNEFDAVFGL